MSERVYLDYNASAPILAPVRAAMQEGLALIGNASSVHGHGRQVRAAIETARQAVGQLVGADVGEVVFTSGGTEANNLALSPGVFSNKIGGDPQLFVSSIEHPSVLNGMRFERDAIRLIPVTSEGVVDLEWLEAALFAGISEDEIEAGIAAYSRPVLVSVMAANNETGVIQPSAEIARLVRKAGGYFHADCVQALGKMDIDMTALGADMISLSAHKIGGPQGVGALVLKDRSILLRDVLIAGGGQELKRRSGTENLIGIIGFGAAAKALLEAKGSNLDDIARKRQRLEDGIIAVSPEAVIFGEAGERLVNVCCFGVPGFSAETQVIQFDLKGISISSGSACSSGKVERSHVLAAMGVDDDLSFAALRVSLGPDTSDEDIDAFLTAWAEIYGRVRDRESADDAAA